jgi:peptide/nickel transport system substrate-binding protein
LAISWEVKNKGKVWTFTLREGVKFHDGTAFNAEAVVFSFQRQMEKKFKYRYYNFPLFENMFGNIKNVKAIDQNTVEFSLFESFSPFLATLTTNSASIVSPTAVKKYKEKFNENPVGSGPFKFKSWERGKRIALTHNPEYWRGKSDYKEFVFIINSNLEALHNSFGKQKIDVLNSFSISRSVSLRKMKWATFSIRPIISVSYIVFNFNNPYLNREKIRRAIRHLWDPRFIKYVYQDFVVPLDLILPAGFIKHERISGLEYFSPAKAKKLLNEAGISEEIKLDFLLLNQMGLDRRMISLFSKNLDKTGIKLRIKSFSDVEYKKRIRNGNFDLTLSSWIADYPDPHNILASLFYTQLPVEGFANLSPYKNSDIPDLINQASCEDDIKKRNTIYKAVVRMIDEKVLCIPIYQNTSVIVFNNKKISRIVVTAIGNVSLFDIKKK